MRAVIQRVKEASVKADGQTIGAVGEGLCVLLGVAEGDTERDGDFLAEKIVNLRIFEDEGGKMNRSLLDTGGGLLVVSQFTLLADCRKGRRPSFTAAAAPETARCLYEAFTARCRRLGLPVATGRFGARMAVRLINDGPVTLVIDSP